MPGLKYPLCTSFRNESRDHTLAYSNVSATCFRSTSTRTVVLFLNGSAEELTGKLVAITRSKSSVSTPIRRHDVRVT